MQRGAGGRSVGQHLLQRAEHAARLDAARTPQVHVRQHIVAGGDLERPPDLLAAGGRRVGEPEADAQRTLVEALLQPLLQRSDLLRRHDIISPACRTRRGTTGRRGFPGRIGDLAGGRGDAVHDADARSDVADARAVVDVGLPRACGVPLRDREDAELELERRRHAVERLQARAETVLAVGMQIDETRRHHETADIDGPAAADRPLGNDGDAPIDDADMADGIGARGGVDDPAVGEDEVGHLPGERRSGERGGDQGERQDLHLRAAAARRSVFPSMVHCC